MDYNEFNFKIDQLKNNLYKSLQESKLPIGAIFYLVKDIYNNLQNQYIASINSYSMSKPQAQITQQIDLNPQSSENNSEQ